MREIIFLTEANADAKNALARFGAEQIKDGRAVNKSTQTLIKKREKQGALSDPDYHGTHLKYGDSTKVGSLLVGRQVAALKKQGASQEEVNRLIDKGRAAKKEYKDNKARDAYESRSANTGATDTASREIMASRNRHGMSGRLY